MRRGEGVRVVTTKWGDRPHWEFAGRYLGADGHGHWIGFPAGSRFARPGSEFVAEHDHVTLVPGDGGYLATFWPAHAPVEVYVDVATPPRCNGQCGLSTTAARPPRPTPTTPMAARTDLPP